MIKMSALIVKQGVRSLPLVVVAAYVVSDGGEVVGDEEKEEGSVGVMVGVEVLVVVVVDVLLADVNGGGVTAVDAVSFTVVIGAVAAVVVPVAVVELVVHGIVAVGVLQPCARKSGQQLFASLQSGRHEHSVAPDAEQIGKSCAAVGKRPERHAFLVGVLHWGLHGSAGTFAMIVQAAIHVNTTPYYERIVCVDTLLCV